MTKFDIKTLVLITAMFAVALVACTTADAQSSDSKKVTVYFWEVNHPGDGDDLIPFARYVDKSAPLRPTIEALVKGPTKAEEAKGVEGVAYGGLNLSSVAMRRGTARIDFKRAITQEYNPGDLETLRFESAVIRTAKQFPEVKKVIVCVNGINEFGIGMVEDAPHPCPKNW